MIHEKYFTLITGASQGIGKAIAFECARKGINLFLVALPNKLLDDTIREIKGQFNVEVLSYGIDLTEEKEPDIFRAIKPGAILENVVFKENGDVDYMDSSITQNTRTLINNKHTYANHKRGDSSSARGEGIGHGFKMGLKHIKIHGS